MTEGDTERLIDALYEAAVVRDYGLITILIEDPSPEDPLWDRTRFRAAIKRLLEQSE